MRKLQAKPAPLHSGDDVLVRKRVNLPNKTTVEELPQFEPMVPPDQNKTTDSSLPKSIMGNLKEEAPPLSILLLNLVAVIWGSQHAVCKMVVDDSQPAAFTLLRFAVAALIASPYTPGIGSGSGSFDDEQGVKAWRWGLEMGIWMFLGFSLQAIGLTYTTAQRSGFLIYLNVKFVPFFARVLFGRRISIPTWLSAATAFLGTALIASDGQSIGFNAGDVWTIAAAASSAMFILRLEEATLQVEDSASLNSACLWTVLTLSFLWTFGASALSVDHLFETAKDVNRIASSHPFELLYLGGVTTALCNFIQTKAQKHVSAERASVIYSKLDLRNKGRSNVAINLVFLRFIHPLQALTPCTEHFSHFGCWGKSSEELKRTWVRPCK
jgi:drug/metabolite transporter (DMT)-like permease